MSETYLYNFLFLPFTANWQTLPTLTPSWSHETVMQAIGKETTTVVRYVVRSTQYWMITGLDATQCGRIEETLQMAMISKKVAAPIFMKGQFVTAVEGNILTITGNRCRHPRAQRLFWISSFDTFGFLTVTNFAGEKLTVENNAAMPPAGARLFPIIYGTIESINTREANGQARHWFVTLREASNELQIPFFEISDEISLNVTVTGENWNQFVSAEDVGADELLSVGISGFSGELRTDVIDGGTTNESSSASISMSGFMESMPLIEGEDTTTLGVFLSGGME